MFGGLCGRFYDVDTGKMSSDVTSKIRNEETVHHFLQLMWADTVYVGCASNEQTGPYLLLNQSINHGPEKVAAAAYRDFPRISIILKFRAFLRLLPRFSLKSKQNTVYLKHANFLKDIPGLYSFAKQYAFLFSTSAEVERLFLYHNKFLTDDRRSLKSETIEWFLFLYLNL